MFPLFSLLAAQLSVGAISGEAICPTPAQVERELTQLLGQGTRQRFRLEQTDHGARLELRSEADALVAERELAEQGSCGESASAFAVIIAAWEAQLRPGALPPPRLVRSFSPAPEAPLELGVGLGLSLSAGPHSAVAPGVALEGTVGEVERGFGALLGLNAAAARTLPLDPGEVRWQRFGLELGPRYRVALASSVHLDLHVEAAAALLELRGVGFSRDLARQAFDFGGGGAARLGWRSRPFTPWVQLGARGWIPRQVVQVTQVEEQVTVPALELVLAAGMAWVSP